MVSVSAEEYREILASMKARTLAKNPRMSNWNPHSALTVLYEVLAYMLAWIMALIREAKDSNFVPTATGADLDRLVRDRLPEGRYQGTRSAGEVTFIRELDGPAVTISAGTQLSAFNGLDVIFETVETITLLPGILRETVDVIATEAGSGGNLAIGMLNSSVLGIPGIDRIYNFSPMTGGTDVETDKELKERYIYTYDVVGAAIPDSIERALDAIDNVTEGHVAPAGPGAVHVVVDGAYDDDEEVSSVLVQKLASGIVSAGLRTGVISDGVLTVDPETCAGGHIYMVVKEFIEVGGTVEITGGEYNSQNAFYPIQFVIPDNTPANSIIHAIVEDEETSFLTINDEFITDVVGLEAEIFIGWGEYPYAWRKPFWVGIDISAQIELSAFAPTNILESIAASVARYVNSHRIEENIDWGKVFHSLLQNFLSAENGFGDSFSSIHSVAKLEIESEWGEFADGPDNIIVADNDERLYCARVIINGDTIYVNPILGG